jgi:hypothetical protein
MGKNGIKDKKLMIVGLGTNFEDREQYQSNSIGTSHQLIHFVG